MQFMNFFSSPGNHADNECMVILIRKASKIVVKFVGGPVHKGSLNSVGL